MNEHAGQHATRTTWTRRGVLALGLVAVGSDAVPRPARAAPVNVGRLAFTVPTTVSATAPDAALGVGWQWQGRDTGTAARPRTVVLARADLPSTDPEEILGLLLASSAAGALPDLRLAGVRSRSMPGGGNQSRLNLTYAAGPDLDLHGTLLIATRAEPPAALLAVLGDDQLTAGTIDGVLESARWLS